MVLKNSFNFINEFFFYLFNQARKIYLNSSFYNKRISKIDNKNLEYKPSPSLLSSLIKYNKKKNKIEDFYLNSIWTDTKIKENDYVAITDVGAYGMSLSSNYNTRPLIAEIIVNGSKHKIIRKRQSLQSLVNN